VKPFKSLVVTQQPVDRLWVTVRDRMPELAAMLDDIQRITVIERQTLPAGGLRLVNEWRATPRLPVSIESVTGTDAFVWLDHAEWNESDRRCHWRIEPQFLDGRIQCQGVTLYEPAMGGRGSRVTFEGTLHMAAPRAGAASLLERSVAPIVESIVTVMIPKNFRKIVEAAARLDPQ